MGGSPTAGLPGTGLLEPGATQRLISTGVPVFAGLLFVLAGWMSVMAAQLRWDAACVGGFDTVPCVLIQDHRYDYLLPTEPWDPIPGAAELAGASYIVIGLAIALVCAAVRAAAWARMLQALLVLSVLLLGVTTFLSGRAGAPIEPATAVVTWLIPLWMVALPMALMVLVTQFSPGSVTEGFLPPPAWALWAGLLVLATPFPEYFIGSLVVGYTSHDTTPWTGAVSGVMVGLAGVVLLAGMAWNAVHRRRLSSARPPIASMSQG